MLAAEGRCMYLHGILVTVPNPSEDVFSLPCPPDGAARQGDHAQALLNPFAPGHLSVHVHPFLGCPAFVIKLLVALVLVSICAATLFNLVPTTGTAVYCCCTHIKMIATNALQTG